MYMYPASFIFTLGLARICGRGGVEVGGRKHRAVLRAPSDAIFRGCVEPRWILFEALKVMPLLSEAVFNPAIISAPAPASGTTIGDGVILAEKRGSPVLIIATIVVFAVLVSGLTLINLYDRRLRNSSAFASAIGLASQSAAVKTALGEPLNTGTAVRGMVNDRGYAALSIPMSGTARKGTLYVVANRMASGWDIERAVLETDGASQKIDLTPPTKPEPFQYPAPGRVYLVPLDDASLSDVNALPAYFKARLGLDVTVPAPAAA